MEMQITPNNKRFKQSLKCGTGLAYLLLQRHPEIDFSGEIEKAALTNYAYDAQSEGSRAIYIAGLIDQCKQKEKIITAVLKALATERKAVWALNQLFDLAAIFAQNGNKLAREAIFQQFHNNPIQGAEWCGQDQIIALDGLEGLLFIATKRGKSLLENPDDWEDSYWVDYFQETHPDIKVYEALIEAGNSNIYIKKYVDVITMRKNRDIKTSPKPFFTYEKITKKIKENKVIPVSRRLALELTQADLQKLAKDFLKETNSLRLEKYLRIFITRKYPFDYQPLFKIAQRPTETDYHLTEFACETMKFFKGEDIRQFAIQQLTRSNQPSTYLPLLISNYQKGDHLLLSEIASKDIDDDTAHDLLCHFIAIYKANSTKKCKEPLELLYNKSNCGIHRFDLVKILHANGVLSDKIKEEIAFDSYAKTRKFYSEIQKSK